LILIPENVPIEVMTLGVKGKWTSNQMRAQEEKTKIYRTGK
jgi:hypothetical protein